MQVGVQYCVKENNQSNNGVACTVDVVFNGANIIGNGDEDVLHSMIRGLGVFTAMNAYFGGSNYYINNISSTDDGDYSLDDTSNNFRLDMTANLTAIGDTSSSARTTPNNIFYEVPTMEVATKSDINFRNIKDLIIRNLFGLSGERYEQLYRYNHIFINISSVV